MQVFLCEKPSQAADIARHIGARTRSQGAFVGSGLVVTWCIGHLLQQAPPEFYEPSLKSWRLDALPVLPTKWEMQSKSSTDEQLRHVCSWLKKAQSVVIATDADREGEVIAREVMDFAGYRGPVQRLWLSAMDDASVRKALAKLQPGQKTESLYRAGLGRAHADWIGGMNLTMGLTAAFGVGGAKGVLHCGRVQTPVLALIVRRERAIKNFVPKPYLVLQTIFDIKSARVPMDWLAPATLLDRDGHIVNRPALTEVANKVRGQRGHVSDVKTEDCRDLAPLPYSLGALQKDASARFGLKAQQVLDAAQALYEKHKATTYPRTDCEYLPLSMHTDAPEVLAALAGSDPALNDFVREAKANCAGRPGRAFNDAKITAHHAIIPTANSAVKMLNMSPNELLVYELVRRRYLAQFLGDFQYKKTTITVECGEQRFSATGKAPSKLGWTRAELVVQKKGTEAKTQQDQTLILPATAVGDIAANLSCDILAKKTTPPKRYTEGTLLAAMESIDREIDDPRLKKVMQTKEKAGIGTDATRASVIEGLFKRDYIASEKKNLVPTDRGHGLIATVERVAPELADPVLTAIWEEQLMQIEAGTVDLAQFERNLGEWVRALLDGIRKESVARPARTMPRADQVLGTARPGFTVAQQTGSTPQQFTCQACGKAMRFRAGLHGGFWGCSGYPGCKNTLPDDEGKPGLRQQRDAGPSRPVASAHQQVALSPDKSAQSPQMTCTACGRPMKRRNGFNGPFWGCTGYPGCRQTAEISDKGEAP